MEERSSWLLLLVAIFPHDDEEGRESWYAARETDNTGAGEADSGYGALE